MCKVEGVQQLFEIQAAKTPKALALVFGDLSLTYGELNRRANFLARRIREAEVQSEAIIGLHMTRSLDMVIGLLAILKAGAAYVPLDPAFPPERLAFILTDSQTQLVLTQAHLRHALPEYSGHTVVIEGGEDKQNPENRTTPESLMFVLYTSGSTGTPKGVLGTHRGILDLCNWTYPGLPSEENGIYCFARSLNFIGGPFDIFRPLLNGRPLIILSEEERTDARLLTQMVTKHGITRLSLTPSLFRSMLDAYPDLNERLRSVETCLLAGEPLSVALCRRVLEALPQVPLLNTYGATEVSGVAAVFDARNLMPDAASVPIGKPIRGVHLSILDSEMQPVASGEAGELYIGGVGVTRGYLNRPELNAERFLADPFQEEPGARLFRTGDRARCRRDGEVEFLGRADDQVQIRGFRIEPGEIENVLQTHPRVRESVVNIRELDAEEKKLVAYVVASDEAANLEEAASLENELRSFLKGKLPEYMVPSHVMALAALPVTSNGKLDRQALQRLPLTNFDEATRRAAPQDDYEQRMQRLWEEAFTRRPIGVTDDFFHLGGHSLLAIRLLVAVEREFGVHLSLAATIQTPTIRDMAQLVRRRQRGEETWSPLVPLQSQGKHSPLFCAPVSGGSAYYYRNLAAHIGSDRPLYTFEPIGMSGSHEPHETLEEMAAYYLEQMRAVQPQGPYFLCGLSFGGVVAFEMARQLKAAGEQIGSVMLFDSWAPGHPVLRENASPNILRAAVQEIHYRSKAHLNHLSILPDVKARMRYLYGGIVRLKQNLLDKAARRPLHSDRLNPSSLELPKLFWNVRDAEARARAAYRPERYSGTIHLLQARVQHPKYSSVPLLGWQPLAAHVEVIITPGTHYSLLDEPCVHEPVRQIRKLLANTSN
jgi:amino acid adenylation domain-containing protein